jgi:hypothetical protein
MTAQLAPEKTSTTQPTVAARPGLVRRVWHQIRQFAAEWHSEARGAIELAMPWGVDEKWHTK